VAALLEDSLLRCEPPQHSCKPLCPCIADPIEAEIEASQRWTLHQHSCKPFGPGWSDPSASEILPCLMLPFGHERDRLRQVICSKQTNEMKELEGKHHTELKAFDERKAKEEMKLQAISKEQAKELAYEGLLVSKVLQVSLSGVLCYHIIGYYIPSSLKKLAGERV